VKIVLLALAMLCALPALADNQTGVAIDFTAKKHPAEIRLLTDGVDVNVTFGHRSHGNFIADFETDRISKQTTLSPSLGYEVFFDYKRFQPYVYTAWGTTTTLKVSTVFSGAVGQGMDFRLNKRLSLRFEHEFDYAKQDTGAWSHRYTGILVWHFK
jgi:hypothetical protein